MQEQRLPSQQEIDQVNQWFHDQTDVWIKRFSGQWQKVKVGKQHPQAKQFFAYWTDAGAIEQSAKEVFVVDLIRWQQEAKEAGAE